MWALTFASLEAAYFVAHKIQLTQLLYITHGRLSTNVCFYDDQLWWSKVPTALFSHGSAHVLCLCACVSVCVCVSSFSFHLQKLFVILSNILFILSNILFILKKNGGAWTCLLCLLFLAIEVSTWNVMNSWSPRFWPSPSLSQPFLSIPMWIVKCTQNDVTISYCISM